MRGVVDGLEEPLELTRGPTVHNQNEGDPHRRRLRSVRGLLVPLDVHVCLPWTQKTKILTQKDLHEGEAGRCTACWELLLASIFQLVCLVALNLPPLHI